MGSEYVMQSLDRIMKVVNVFISKDPTKHLTITEISDRCDIPLSSLHRILRAMIKHRLIALDSKRKLYSLGTAWLEYGLKIYDTMDYISHIRPELEKLMHEVNSSVYLIQPDEGDSIVIERIDCINQSIRSYDKLGLRMPFPRGVANVAMLAHMSDENIKHLKEMNPDESWKELENEIARVKEKGYAIGEDEWSSGVTTVSTAILNHYGQIFGALSVKLETSNNKDTYNNVIKELLDTGNRISWKLGQQ